MVAIVLDLFVDDKNTSKNPRADYLQISPLLYVRTSVIPGRFIFFSLVLSDLNLIGELIQITPGPSKELNLTNFQLVNYILQDLALQSHLQQ